MHILLAPSHSHPVISEINNSPTSTCHPQIERPALIFRRCESSSRKYLQLLLKKMLLNFPKPPVFGEGETAKRKTTFAWNLGAYWEMMVGHCLLRLCRHRMLRYYWDELLDLDITKFNWEHAQCYLFKKWKDTVHKNYRTSASHAKKKLWAYRDLTVSFNWSKCTL